MEEKIIREPFDNDIDEYCSICGDDTIFKVIDGDKQKNGYSCSKVCFCQSCFALLREEIKDYEKPEEPENPMANCFYSNYQNGSYGCNLGNYSCRCIKFYPRSHGRP